MIEPRNMSVVTEITWYAGWSPPLKWCARLRKWLYLRTGWDRFFRWGDWMDLKQMIQSKTREANHALRQELNTVYFDD